MLVLLDISRQATDLHISIFLIMQLSNHFIYNNITFLNFLLQPNLQPTGIIQPYSRLLNEKINFLSYFLFSLRLIEFAMFGVTFNLVTRVGLT